MKKLQNWWIHLVFILFSCSIIVPVIAIVAISLSSETDIIQNGFSLIPRAIDLSGYEYVLKNPMTVLNAYKVTIIMTVFAVVIYLLMASMAAYALSIENFAYKNIIVKFLLFNMLFTPGMVPSYLLMTQYLDLKNTYAALIIPLLHNVFNVFIMRTFISQLPGALRESAMIDGLNEFGIYFRIILPLSKPVLATIGVMMLINDWNSWNQALLYTDEPNMYPIQYMLQIMLRNIQEMTNNMDKMPAGIASFADIPTNSTRMAMAVLAAGPAMFIFPFFQKYFVKGMTVGAVKG